ncbi:MAG: APC family permease [Ktedonobacteraceae bacterium]|nr:APC family permease [Ktedonobacteraceae bacterium]
MAAQDASEVKMVPTLGLTGVTINAMALIAPGAFLWTTYQLQAAPASALNMWAAVFVATAIAMLTAVAYAQLANRYPEAGAGSSYYFAEASILQREEHRHFKFARLSKFIVGWASHLYYWIYPGVMVAFMGLIISYIIQTFVPSFGAPWQEVIVCILFAAIVGSIAYIGVTGSTVANIVINVIQILALVTFSVLAIVYRALHPNVHYLHPSALSVILPHDLSGLIFQSTIAILLVVGFESATALAAEAKNPQRDIPRGVLLSLVIQAVVFYFLEYFAANFFINTGYTSGSGKTLLSGFAAASASGAPIGDMAKIIGDSLLGGNGTLLATVIALTVVIALIGTALSCLNTGVRVTYAMGKDTELPIVFGFLHGKYRTPHVGVIVLTVLSAIIGSYGVINIDHLTQVTLVSNIGTFLLYGMTCLICIIAFAGIAARNVFTTVLAPALGAILNVAMLLGVLYFAFAGGGSGQTDTLVALVFCLAWLVIGFGYLYIRKWRTGEPILHPEDHKDKVGLPSEMVPN